jgi:hypothetical protein
LIPFLYVAWKNVKSVLSAASELSVGKSGLVIAGTNTQGAAIEAMSHMQ